MHSIKPLKRQMNIFKRGEQVEMSDKERSCWYALLLSIIKNMDADESLRIMRVSKECVYDR